MKYVVIILLLNLGIIIHELGHAIAIWKNGIEVEEIAIGLPFPKIPFIRLSRQVSVNFFGFSIKNLRLSIYPLLIGAFVKTTDESDKKLERLPITKQIGIYWAGPFANLLVGLLCLLGYISFTESFIIVIVAIIVIVILGFLISLPYILSRYRKSCFLVPLLGIVVLFSVPWLFFTMKDPTAGLTGLMGPVGIVAEGPKMLSNGFVVFFIVISICLGLVNAFPIPPLDGGNAVTALLQEWGMISKKIAMKINRIGINVLYVLLIFITLHDIFRLFR